MRAEQEGMEVATRGAEWVWFIFMEFGERRKVKELKREKRYPLPILERESRRDLYKYSCPLK